MNKPYTCHNCGTTFETYEDSERDLNDIQGQGMVPLAKVMCYGVGSCGEQYIVDRSGTTVKKADV